jgi:hypothetical protein
MRSFDLEAPMLWLPTDGDFFEALRNFDQRLLDAKTLETRGADKPVAIRMLIHVRGIVRCGDRAAM